MVFLTEEEKMQAVKENVKDFINTLYGLTEEELKSEVIEVADAMEEAQGNGTNLSYKAHLKHELITYLNYLLDT